MEVVLEVILLTRSNFLQYTRGNNTKVDNNVPRTKVDATISNTMDDSDVHTIPNNETWVDNNYDDKVH